MPDVAADLRAMIAASADFGESTNVILENGATVQAAPSVATLDDALKSDAIISGQTRSLRFATDDVPGLREGKSRLTWNGKVYRVNSLQLEANGHVTVAFLGAP